ncbi:MAG TPA: helix-turn-helix transcriptional regulator, partial [Longimicrobiaceae bacterium]|nr:helix-turn-helix transcriptional regulator [Longimicrobiaceae bacterium]
RISSETPVPLLVGYDRELPLEALSPREREVFALASTGLTNKEIASHLGVAPGTVKIHLHAIFRKLGIRRRVELTRLDA